MPFCHKCFLLLRNKWRVGTKYMVYILDAGFWDTSHSWQIIVLFTKMIHLQFQVCEEKHRPMHIFITCYLSGWWSHRMIGYFTWMQRNTSIHLWCPDCHHFESIPDSKVHGAHLGPTGPRWAPWWPHELCYLGWYANLKRNVLLISQMS